jgi:hypothetical protein
VTREELRNLRRAFEPLNDADLELDEGVEDDQYESMTSDHHTKRVVVLDDRQRPEPLVRRTEVGERAQLIHTFGP